MDAKMTKILSYITWVGWLIAFLAGDKEAAGVKQHLNQALLINIIAIIPIGITQLVAFVFMIMGIVKAIQDNDEPLPLIGGVAIIK